MLPDSTDFSAYFHAARDILHGKSPYRDPALFYPPLLGLFMLPLALFDYVAARWIWFVLSHLFLIGAGALLWRDIGGGRIALCCIACIWALGGALGETLEQGQLSPLLVLLLVVAYTHRGRMGGASAGVSFGLKYFPGIIVVPLLIGRRWRASKFAAIVAVAGVGLPWLFIATFLAGPRAPVSAAYWMGTPSMYSWSVASLVLRLLTPIRRGAPFPADWQFGNAADTLNLGHRLQWISVTTACLVFAVGMAIFWRACRGRLSNGQIPWAMAGSIALSLAVAPVCWSHYQVLQYPGVAMLLIAAIRRKYWGLAFAVVASFAFAYQLPQKFLIDYYVAHSGWTTSSPATLYFWTSVPPLATLAIFGLAMTMMSRETATVPHELSSRAGYGIAEGQPPFIKI